jgi:4-hydroxy-tetrahydrodipicolinate synthase
MFSGSIVALVTPMNDDHSIDWASLEKLLDWHVAEGSDGIISMGTTGESATLDVKEHLAVIEKTVQYIDGRIPVIAGTGANSTSEAIELTLAAKNLGADAALLVTPYYNKPTQEGLYLHHKAIAEAVALPQLLYNVPGRTACDMLPETVERLSKIGNIIGIKEATGDISRGVEIRERCADDFLLLSGDDETFVELMKVGAKGNISVTANIAPKAMAAMCKAANDGDFARAQELNSILEDVHKALFLEANPIPVKWALARMAKISEAIRLPLTPFSKALQGELETAMQDAGLI